MNYELNMGFWHALARRIFTSLGIEGPYLKVACTALLVAVSLLVAWGVFMLLTRVLNRAVLRFVAYTAAKWDDVLFNRPMLRSISVLAVVILLDFMIPGSVTDYPWLHSAMLDVCRVAVVAAVVFALNRLIISLYELFESETSAKVASMKGLRQMLQVIVFCVGIIIAISILANRNPLVILSGLGASAAVLMLVFKDSVMGLVAGVQLSLNDMLRPGDWIVVASRGINGTVLEVGLTTVKVQNFDMTIYTIPPYALVSESFQNWRGMSDCGGRRIMRSMCIDSNSIKFDPDGTANITKFRHDLEKHIGTLAVTRKDLTFMVRELQPTPNGLPVEIYMFVDTTVWIDYEHIQADIIDHAIAMLRDHGLRVYQAPAGTDILSLGQTCSPHPASKP